MAHRKAAHCVRIALAALALASAAVRADPAQILAAFETNDITALEALSHSAATPEQRELAAGIVMSLQRRDAAAMAILTRVAQSTASPDVRATAYLAIGDVELRDLVRPPSSLCLVRPGNGTTGKSIDPDGRPLTGRLSVTPAPRGYQEILPPRCIA